MKKILLLFILLLMSACDAPIALPELATAQPEPTNTPSPDVTPLPASDACSVAGQQRQIDAAFAAYQAGRAADESALLGLSAWVGEISAELATTCTLSPTAPSDPAVLADLLAKLQSGGYVLYVRHTHTDRSRSDNDVTLGQCDQQRVLSDRGRDEALFMRSAFQQLALPIDRIISTQYCRTLETAILTFGVPEVLLRSALHETLRERLATPPAKGSNTIIVAHIGTIRDQVGLDDTFEEGDTLIYRPLDDEFEFIGRIGLYDWPVLAALAAE